MRYEPDTRATAYKITAPSICYLGSHRSMPPGFRFFLTLIFVGSRFRRLTSRGVARGGAGDSWAFARDPRFPPRGQALRGASGSCRTCRSEASSGPQARGAADARGGVGGGEPAPEDVHHAPGVGPACGCGPGRTTLPRRGVGPAPGGRPHPRLRGGRLYYVLTWAGFVFLAVVLVSSETSTRPSFAANSNIVGSSADWRPYSRTCTAS